MNGIGLKARRTHVDWYFFKALEIRRINDEKSLLLASFCLGGLVWRAHKCHILVRLWLVVMSTIYGYPGREFVRSQAFLAMFRVVH